MRRPLNLVLFGSDQFSLTCFSKLYESSLVNVLKTVTPPVKDRRNIVPLQRFCNEFNHDCADAPSARKDIKTWMPEWLSNPCIPLDLAVVVSFGYLVPPSVLKCFKFGGINVHPSLLPKYRGPAPIENTILNGETETGVSIIGLHPEIFDAGSILNQIKVKIPSNVKYSELHSLLANQGSLLLYNTLKDFDKYQSVSVSQDEKLVTKAPKLNRNLVFVDWNTCTAIQIDRLHRAISHRYSIDTLFNGKRFILLDITLESPSKIYHQKNPGSIVFENNHMFVKCAQGWIQVLKLKMINKKPTGIVEFMNGHGINPQMDSLTFTSAQSKL